MPFYVRSDAPQPQIIGQRVVAFLRDKESAPAGRAFATEEAVLVQRYRDAEHVVSVIVRAVVLGAVGQVVPHATMVQKTPTNLRITFWSSMSGFRSASRQEPTTGLQLDQAVVVGRTELLKHHGFHCSVIKVQAAELPLQRGCIPPSAL
jgi:hypothetical protein